MLLQLFSAVKKLEGECAVALASRESTSHSISYTELNAILSAVSSNVASAAPAALSGHAAAVDCAERPPRLSIHLMNSRL